MNNKNVQPSFGSWKIICFFYLALSFSVPVFSQYTIRLELISLPATHETDSIFLAGNFNNWQPGKAGFSFFRNKNISFIELTNITLGAYEFKFTRGSWQTVECAADGKDLANHSLQISSDTTIQYSIAAWNDDFAAVVKQHTASSRVHIIDTAFKIPQLNRSGRIWLYLPPGYAKSKKKYPVMYMQDGQNIFDEYTSGFGEWGVDECLDSMIKKGKPACIVVGIDNGPRRLTEYNPYNSEQFGKGEGDLYLEFIVKTLKPWIDKRYRTLRSKDNTIIAGSSMGGLISYYALLKYPNIFGNAGVFSPAFWIAPEIKTLTDSLAGKMDGQIFFYMGGNEGEKYLADLEDITNSLGRSGASLIYSVIDPDGSHNEKAWRKWFVEFYSWIMNEGYNNVIKVDN